LSNKIIRRNYISIRDGEKEYSQFRVTDGKFELCIPYWVKTVIFCIDLRKKKKKKEKIINLSGY
jgi:hypothetical protein